MERKFGYRFDCHFATDFWVVFSGISIQIDIFVVERKFGYRTFRLCAMDSRSGFSLLSLHIQNFVMLTKVSLHKLTVHCNGLNVLNLAFFAFTHCSAALVCLDCGLSKKTVL